MYETEEKSQMQSKIKRQITLNEDCLISHWFHIAVGSQNTGTCVSSCAEKKTVANPEFYTQEKCNVEVLV